MKAAEKKGESDRKTDRQKQRHTEEKELKSNNQKLNLQVRIMSTSTHFNMHV